MNCFHCLLFDLQGDYEYAVDDTTIAVENGDVDDDDDESSLDFSAQNEPDRNEHAHHRMRKHDKIYSHKCNQCGKTFLQGSTLNRHQRYVHEGKRPYSCAVCSKSFGANSDLKRHSLVHTKARPYSCTECTETFTHPSSLLSHRKTVHPTEIQM